MEIIVKIKKHFFIIICFETNSKSISIGYLGGKPDARRFPLVDT
jgi:hypothetical protein